MDTIKQELQKVCKALFDMDVEPELSRPDEQFGDFATNVALQLAGQLNKNPREIAEQLVEKLRSQLAEAVSDITIAVPGFINIRLRDSLLWSLALTADTTSPYADKAIVIETNNPNPFKDMHIGHAYNSIVADTIANLLEAGGGNVHRVSYHGDVGLHVGVSMWSILRFIEGNESKLAEIDESDRPTFMSRMYQEGTVAYQQDELAKKEIDTLTKLSFTLDDPLYKNVYETCKAWSFAYFDSIFERIGSRPIEKRYLEREADTAGRAAVESKLGTVFQESDGAIIFPGEQYGPGMHTVVMITQRGNTLYSARDLGLIQLKAKDYQPEASYIVTAVEQKDYFKTILKAAELALPDVLINTTNIPTGTVKLSTGKMSSRKGNFINIGWLVDSITTALVERSGQEAATQDSIIGALRYTMLKVRIGSDVVFDVSEAISIEGNSGPYLQYAHARARSILKKSTVHSPQSTVEALEAGERSLVRKIGEYSEVVDNAVTELMPHYVCTYLYELAQVFNSFYEHNRVIGDPRQDLRLQLVSTYANTLKKGLQLLNIAAPDKM